MVDVPVSARVECADGPGGWSTGVIIDPTTREATHFVVKESRSPHVERLVSVDLVAETTSDLIRLRCTRRKLATLAPFVTTKIVRSERPRYTDVTEPYSLSRALREKEIILVPVTYEHIRPGELAVRRNARVKAKDGYVGRVDEFLVNPRTRHITHLVLRERRLWGRKEVTVPVSEIDRMDEETISLKHDWHNIKSSPAIV
jgi:hypothetical protein